MIIKADGKYVLPGLFDSQNSYSWYFGEAMLNHGVTSTIDVGTTGETAVPYRDAVFHGKVRGPRTFTGVSRLSVNPNALVSTGLENPLTHTRVPKSAEETREFVRAWIAAGADYILTYDGALPMDYYQAALRRGQQSGHSRVHASLRPGLVSEGRRAFGRRELAAFRRDRHRRYQGSLQIQAGPRRPERTRSLRGNGRPEGPRPDSGPGGAPRVSGAYVHDQFSGISEGLGLNSPPKPRRSSAIPSLLAYYPPNAVQGALQSYIRIDQGELRERRMKGYQNAMRFHKMFVDAGGHLVVSGNTNDAWVPGVDLHQEMQIMSEAGLTPMQIIMGSTKYPAEMLRKQNLLGTVEAGKLADVIIVNADPLQDIKNLDKINTVIQDGKIVELGYHANYSSPFANVAAATVSVEGLPWAVDMKKASRRRAKADRSGAPTNGAIPDPAFSPQPAIETMNPIIVTQGDSAMVTLTGFNFVRRSAVYFNGRPAPFRAVSATEIQVTLDAGSLARGGKIRPGGEKSGAAGPILCKEHVGQRNVKRRPPHRRITNTSGRR